jgi:hypothetical protein
MVMKKFVVLVVAMCALAGCDKPSESDCKKAIANIRLLLGTDKLTEDTGLSAGWVRSCQGSAKRSTVKCAMEASTVEQLQRCGLVKPEDFEDPAPADAGSGATKK